MADDEKLAARVREAFGRKRGVTEKKMFGGLAFMLHGNMCCGVANDDLMLRLGEEGAERALCRANTRPMDFTGTPLKTMVYVEPAGVQSTVALAKWVGEAIDFAASLPRKG